MLQPINAGFIRVENTHCVADVCGLRCSQRGWLHADQLPRKTSGHPAVPLAAGKASCPTGFTLCVAVPSAAQVLEELQDGTSKPLKVLGVVKKPKLPSREAQRRMFVLKRSGGAGGTTRNAHIVSEFAAMAMHARAGLLVPQAALYTVKASCIYPLHT